MKELHVTQETPNGEYTVTLDDDQIVPKLIENASGIRTMPFSSPMALLAQAPNLRPIAAFIDIHLGHSDLDGLSVVPRLRDIWRFTPIIVITADSQDQAIAKALSSGADDFVRKPIRPLELMSRLQCRLVDQARKESNHVVAWEDVEFDSLHSVLHGPSGVKYVSNLVGNLLSCLIEARGTIVSRVTIKNRCWGNITVTDNAIDRKIHEARKALSDVSSTLRVRTHYGIGFAILNNAMRSNLRPVT